MGKKSGKWWASAVGLVAIVGALFVAPAPQAQAVSAADFDPGFIISDAIFFDRNAMDEAQIQSFLRSRLPSCAQSLGVPCLPNYIETTPTRAATTRCAAYAGAANEPASRIIDKVAKACGINPQVLIVTLQKENSLVTRPSPSAASYRTAMGYACPDTAACDSTYFGFFNQVYSAASQFIRYGVTPTNWRYRPGNVAVQFHPNVACGSTIVNIRNQATANLYNYTPYQPNAAAMANLGGTGDSCSSYGNRNFFVFFSSWFGSPIGKVNPFGAVDIIAGDIGAVRVQGWAIDPDSSSSLEIHVYINGVGSVLLADQSRPDVGALYPTAGPLHGFSALIPVPSGGSHMVCVNAINIGPGTNQQLGDCKLVTTRSGPPVVVIDTVTTAPGSVTVSGWAFDPDTADPITLRVTVDGSATEFVAGAPRADVAANYPGYGPNVGYTQTLPATAGLRTVCVTALNVGQGTDAALPCRTVTVPSSPGAIPDLGRAPFGALDPTIVSPTGVTVRGWAIDPDTTAPIRVHIYVGANGLDALANKSRADIGAIYPVYGPNHAFSEVFATAPGPQRVCAYAINSGNTGPSNTLLGCQTVTVPYPPGFIPNLGRAPFGVIDTVTADQGSVSISGWAIDPDTSDPIRVHLYAGSIGLDAAADKPRDDVAAAYPGYGPNHAYSETIAVSPGPQRVCAYAINNGAGPGHTPLGCRTVTVPYPPGFIPDLGRAPFGVVDSMVATAGQVTISGWAIDPDTASPIRVHLYVGTTGLDASADKSREDVAAAYPGYGSNHGYSETISVPPGSHFACVYAINNGSGPSSKLLGCRMIAVPAP